MTQGQPLGESLRAYMQRRFDGIGMEVPLAMLKQELWGANRVQVFAEDKIVKLDIRFSELWHKCTDEEWTEFQSFLTEQGIPILTPP